MRQIELTLADSALVKSLRSKAYQRAKSRYSWDAVTDAYEKLFEQLLANGLS
jgi:glycosyltransferase involved in cell wall biosynthesis